MTPEKWTEEKIEKQLGQMPNIEDHRSPADILYRLKQDERLAVKPQKLKRSFPWMPAVATLASVMLIGLLLPLFLLFNGSDADKSAQMESRSMADMDMGQNENAGEESEEAGDNGMGLFDFQDHHFAVFPEDLTENTLLPMGFVIDHQVVPLSFLLPNEQISEDFPHASPTELELYEQYAGKVDEEWLGFDAYHPYEGTLSEEDGQLFHALTSDKYEKDQASFERYQQSMRMTFPHATSWKYGQIGKEWTTIDREDVAENTVYAYYQMTLSTGDTYLVREARQGSTVEEALAALAISPTDYLYSIIPSNVVYDVFVEADILHVRFDDEIDFFEMDEMEAKLFIEGIMLTASEFNMAVKFDNVVPFETDKYSTAQALPIPIAANPVFHYFD